MPTDQTDLIAQQDDLRTKRAFVGFLSSAFGLDNQAVGTDGVAQNTPYRFQSIGPTGVAIEGAPVSSAQGATAGMSPMVLVLGIALAVLVLPKLMKAV